MWCVQFNFYYDVWILLVDLLRTWYLQSRSKWQNKNNSVLLCFFVTSLRKIKIPGVLKKQLITTIKLLIEINKVIKLMLESWTRRNIHDVYLFHCLINYFALNVFSIFRFHDKRSAFFPRWEKFLLFMVCGHSGFYKLFNLVSKEKLTFETGGGQKGIGAGFGRRVFKAAKRNASTSSSSSSSPLVCIYEQTKIYKFLNYL